MRPLVWNSGLPSDGFLSNIGEPYSGLHESIYKEKQESLSSPIFLSKWQATRLMEKVLFFASFMYHVLKKARRQLILPLIYKFSILIPASQYTIVGRCQPRTHTQIQRSTVPQL